MMSFFVMMIVPLAVITMMVVTKFRIRSGYCKASLAYYQQKGQFDPTPHLKNRQFELHARWFIRATVKKESSRPQK